ncbi:hypothetical protein ACN20G_27725 (plasmid) [Streptomyces sp. BI20]|uniref:hypothetical protein n=1 Tax=Streptomyces sp. BI20 TaxID=3403460 RepID=UPI003C73F27E
MAVGVLACSLLSVGPAGASAGARSRSDLEVVRLDPDPTTPGGTTEVHAFVVNRGPERTASSFRITLRVPVGLTILPPTYPLACTPPGARVITCAFPAGLNPLETATAVIPVRVDARVPAGSTREGHVSVAGDDDTDPGDNHTPVTFTINAPATG